MDVREKYVMQKVNRKEKSICPNCIHHNLCIAENNQPCIECNQFVDTHGVTVQEWISVKDRLPNLDEAVLVFAEYLHIKTNYYAVWSLFKCQSGETIWVDKFGDGHNLTEVTYWIPLPSAPKGE